MSKRARSGSSLRKNTRKLKSMYKPTKTRASTVVMNTRAPMYKQLKGLLAAKTRDAADVNRNGGPLQNGTVYSYCATSKDPLFGEAASGTGLLDTDADEVLINTLRLKGCITQPAVVAADRTSTTDAILRQIVVWFNKPLKTADADGTLPEIDEVLTGGGGGPITSMAYSSASNGGRFTILSDRTFTMGTNVLSADGAAGILSTDGNNTRVYDYTIKVGRKCKFVAPSASGASAGGHYDLDVDAGRVSTGLLVVYVLTYSAPTEARLWNQCESRLNYTG